jgi:hypothetical protein
VISANSRFRDPKSKIQNPRFVLGLLLLAALAPACAGRRQPVFAPAAREDAERAIAAWRNSVSRADSRGPARLLYDARVSQGPFRMSGTLAVREGRRTVDATLAGPFGDAVARYEEGALRGKGIRPIAIEADELRWLLAGAWKGSETPEVAGIDGQDALLRWSGAQQVEGVIDFSGARFKSLRIRRPEGEIAATYSGSGEASSWPQKIDLEDVKTGNTLRLTLLAAEPVNE